MNKVILIFGSNIGKKASLINQAIKDCSLEIGICLARSSFYESEPWGYTSQNSFYNVVVIFETFFTPDEILKAILQIENRMGRQRTGTGYSDRSMDIDILFYNDWIIKTHELTIPHPKITERRFVLEPLCEIAPDYIHPEFKMTVKKILKNCSATSVIIKLSDIM